MEDRGIKIKITIRIMIVGKDRDAEAFAAEHEPDDAEFPVLETVQVLVWMLVEVEQRAVGDEGFASAFTT
jgi:hypothetical protein